MDEIFEIRDPVHGFIHLNAWERELLYHPALQRLRRIRQLSWTDMVYPGAMHTRFEHTLGVLHIATLMFDRIRKYSGDILREELGYDDAGLDRDRQILRFACLCHDIGHSPFSHAGEDLMPPLGSDGKRYKHEHYSAAIVRYLLSDVISGHKFNENYEIKAEDVATFIEGSTILGRRRLWTSLLTGQVDADRSDYLLRDAHHAGVAYGRFDLHRLINTLRLFQHPTNGSFVIAVEEGGVHAAEALIIARYMMFTQVYFHKTRRAYEVDGCIIPDACFPSPTAAENLAVYLKWNDWHVLGRIDQGAGGEHGKILTERRHHRVVFQTNERPTAEELLRLESIRSAIAKFSPMIDQASNSWYKSGGADIPIINWDGNNEHFASLSNVSNVVAGLQSVKQIRVYVPAQYAAEAKAICNGTN